MITVACAAPAHESAAAKIMQVEVLMHSKDHILLGMHPATNSQIVKFEWSTVRTGNGKP